MLNYNAAGPYPSCFDNLNSDQKKEEHEKILKRNFDHLIDIIKILKPKSVLPFAGSYILGGKNVEKNDYLGTTTWDVCAEYLKNKQSISKIICMLENQMYDFKTKNLLSEYVKIDTNHMKKYLETIKSEKYDYENDKKIDHNKLLNDLDLAKKNLVSRIKKFNVTIKSNVFLNINNKDYKVLEGTDTERIIKCEMDTRLLRRILDRKSHWNNAEIGCHITFNRSPNEMEPDVHKALCFLHL